MMPETTHVKNVAIIGATGRMGKVFLEHLLATKQYSITVLTRSVSDNPTPGVKTIEVDYASPALTSALADIDVLLVTLAAFAPPGTLNTIVNAALAAKVPYILPNYYGSDPTFEPLVADAPYMQDKIPLFSTIAHSSSSRYIALACGFWYEWSMACGEQWFGFDVRARKAVLYNEGTTVMTTSTWEQCGRAITALLALPRSGAQDSIDALTNQPLFIKSFRITQRDMLDSLHRVLGTSDADWSITYEDTVQREQDGKREFAEGNFLGLAKSMYARHFGRDGAGDSEARHEMHNQTLGLPVEELDAATKRAVDMVESGWKPFG